MYKQLFFLLFILLTFATRAQTPVKKAIVKKTPQTLQIDSSNISIRNFNRHAIDIYHKDPTFDYHTEEVKTGLSWWHRFWAWVWHFIESLFSHTTGNASSVSPVIKYLLLASAIGGLIFLVIKLLGSDWINIFSKESKQVNIPYNESMENIHEITFDEEIEKALTQHNYRLAVRLLYLSSLKQLNDAQLINWQIEKTNSAYLNELVNTDQRQSFSVLTRQFEYVWYGDFPVNGQSFQNIQTLFMDFKKLLP